MSLAFGMEGFLGDKDIANGGNGFIFGGYMTHSDAGGRFCPSDCFARGEKTFLTYLGLGPEGG